MSVEMRAKGQLRGQRGFTLIEVIAASFVLLIGAAAVLSMFTQANNATSRNKARQSATSITRDLIEVARGLEFDAISNTTLPGLLKAQPGLQDAVATSKGYELTRQGIVFTVNASACTMDDGRDGGGVQAGGGFCSESVQPNTQVNGRSDTNPEDYKRVTIKVDWKNGNRPASVQQTLLLNNPGSAGGPAVRSLGLQGFASPPPVITAANAPATGRMTVEFTTSSKPTATDWFVDSAAQPKKPVGGSTGREFTATWETATLVDGTYVLGASAYDKFGVSGPSRSLSVTINRYLPTKPTGLVGGRNGTVVELSWNGNPERDIVGYVVYRRGTAGTDQIVCSLSDRTTCIDAAPLNDPALDYRVVAYDLDPGTSAPRPGTLSDPLRVTLTNQPPNAAVNLGASINASGGRVLTWERPTPQDPDTGDEIDFYRIYRDGVRYGQRNATGTTETWTDDDPGGVAHSYSVVAVDTKYMESLPAEIVR